MENNIKCTFCEKLADSKDHIPSRNLLEKPFPKNLLTVPSCRECNQSFSLDEEYFLNVLVEISNNPKLVARKSLGGNVYKARQRSPKLKAKIEKSYFQNENGKYYFKTEYDRIKRVIEKNALGLYYFKYKKRMSLGSFNCTGFYPFEVEENRPAEIFMLTYSEKFKIKKWIHIQPNVFSFIVVRDWTRNNRFTMIFHVHNTVWCIIEIPHPASNKSGSNKRYKTNQPTLFS